MTKDKIKWAYLAGIVDGEGCISIHVWRHAVVDKRYGREHEAVWTKNLLQFDVTNTNKVLIRFLIKNFGGRYHETDLHNPKWKHRHNWRPQDHQHMKRVLLGILPYLVLKREQAKLALTYIAKRERGDKDGYDILAKQCKKLNAKGPSVETNTLAAFSKAKIESALIGDNEHVGMVTYQTN